MTLTLRAAARTDLGLIRKNNEDCLHAGARLVAVADGMGGLPAGELASALVLRELLPLDESPTADPLAALRAAVDAGNRRVRARVRAEPDDEGMGTTVTALLLAGDDLALAHVGDSRCYLLRDRVLRQVTRDDTYVQALVDQGALAPADARRHPQRSMVTEAVQGHGYRLSTEVLAARAGDRFLLCSDGLSDVVDDDAIGQTLRDEPNRSACAELLVKHALLAGGPDNISVVVADVCAT
jgi:protein phosphatase